MKHYLKPLKLNTGIDVDVLSTCLASGTDGASGADLEFLCQSAARICVKEAVSKGTSDSEIVIAERHIQQALQEF